MTDEQKARMSELRAKESLTGEENTELQDLVKQEASDKDGNQAENTQEGGNPTEGQQDPNQPSTDGGNAPA